MATRPRRADPMGREGGAGVVAAEESRAIIRPCCAVKSYGGAGVLGARSLGIIGVHKTAHVCLSAGRDRIVV